MERVYNDTISEYVVENANLRLMVKQLQYELEDLRAEKEGESDVLKQEGDTSGNKKVEK